MIKIVFNCIGDIFSLSLPNPPWKCTVRTFIIRRKHLQRGGNTSRAK